MQGSHKPSICKNHNISEVQIKQGACRSSVKMGTLYHLVLYAWFPAQFLTCRRSSHQRAMFLYWQVILPSTFLRWASHVGPFNVLLLPSFQTRIFMSPLFPQSCFEEEVFLILSNVRLNSSALDLTRSCFSCTLPHKLLLLSLPSFVSFSTLTFPHNLQMGSVPFENRTNPPLSTLFWWSSLWEFFPL